MAGIGVRHLGQGVWWREAAWQHHEEEVRPDASPGTCLDLEAAARAPPYQPGGEAVPFSQMPDSLTAEVVLGG